MKKKKGCLSIFVVIIVLFAAFLFWPVSDSDQSVVLSDSFDNNDNDWDLQDSGKIENGELFISTNSDAVIIPSDVSFKNGSIGVDLLYKGGDASSAFGVMFRSSDTDGSFDLFLIDFQSNFVVRYDGNTDLSGTSGYISKEGTNSLKIELYGKLLKISVNGNPVVEVYEKNPVAGRFAFFSSGDSEVSFDNLEIIDFDKEPANISGVVYYNDEKLSTAPVTAYKVVDDKTLKEVIIDETLTNDSGEYSFYLPDDASYFVESRIENGKTSSDRYTDMRIPDSGLNLDIHLTSEGN